VVLRASEPQLSQEDDGSGFVKSAVPAAKVTENSVQHGMEFPVLDQQNNTMFPKWSSWPFFWIENQI
jgi:hypothetical protein